jgi:hypothetical protein
VTVFGLVETLTASSERGNAETGLSQDGLEVFLGALLNTRPCTLMGYENK